MDIEAEPLHCGEEGSTSDAFFMGLSKSMQDEFEKRLAADRAKLRRQYDAELLRAQEGFQSSLAKLTASVHSLKGPSVGGSDADLPGPAALRADHLRHKLFEMRSTSMPYQGIQGDIPFDPEAFIALQGFVNECKSLEEYAERCLAQMTQPLKIRKLDGSECQLTVSPAIETVAVAKVRLARENMLSSYKLEFFPAGSTIVMRNADLLAAYDLSGGVDVVLQERGANLHLSWDAAAGRWHDATGNFDFLAVDEPLAYEDGALLCRGGTLDQLLICPSGAGPFRDIRMMPDGIAVAATGWSCSFFTCAPRSIDNDNYYCRTLLGAKPDVSHILLNSLKLGTFTQQGGHQEIDFNMGNLAEGWRHVCVIADPETGYQTFYVDGVAVGRLPAVMAPIFKIGNSSDGAQSWACPINDLQIFLRPLEEDVVASFVAPDRVNHGANQESICRNPRITL